MRRYINLTQHDLTQDQIEAGAYEPTPEDKAKIKKLLTFDEPPTYVDLFNRAHEISKIVREGGYNAKCALIGGAPYFMCHLENSLLGNDIVPVYAFSKRVSVEEQQPDGSVVKKNVFKHEAFISNRVLEV